jgi:hypothetical protein
LLQTSSSYFQVTDSKRKIAMPDFRAKPEKPYGSSTLATLFILAHKVIHSFRAKAALANADTAWVAPAVFLRRDEFLNGINDLD